MSNYKKFKNKSEKNASASTKKMKHQRRGRNHGPSYRHAEEGESYRHVSNRKGQKHGMSFEGWTMDGRNMSALEEPDILSYVDRVQEMMQKDQFESDLERLEFVDGVFREVTKCVEEDRDAEFLKTLNDTKISRVVQNLLDIATEKQTRYMCSRFLKKKELLPYFFTGKFTSFLLQTIFKNAPYVIEQESLNEEDEEEALAAAENDEELAHRMLRLPLMTEMLESICSALKGLWSSLAQNQLGSFSVRSLLQTLIKVEMTQEFQRIMEELLHNLEFENWISDRHACPILVAVAEVMPSSHPMFKQLLRLTFGIASSNADIEEALGEKSVRETVMYRIGHSTMCHIVEAFIKSMDRTLFDSCFTKVFYGRLKQMCHTKCGLFVAATIVNHCTHKEQFNATVTEFVDEEFDSLYHHCKHVVVALLNGCVKFDVQQKEMTRALLKTVGVSGTDAKVRRQFISKLIYMDESSRETNAHGCQVAVALLKFQNNKAQVLEECAKNLDTEALISMCFDKHASRVFEQMIIFVSKSKPIRTAIFTKLKGQYARLAVNVYGSRALEVLMHHLGIHHKQEIADELVSQKTKLMTSRFGIIIWNKYQLVTYTKQAEKWLTDADRQTKREQMFDNILSAPIKTSSERNNVMDVNAGEAKEEMEEETKDKKKKKKEKKKEKKSSEDKEGSKKRKLQVIDDDIFAIATGSSKQQKKRATKDEEESDENATASLSNVLNLLKSKRKSKKKHAEDEVDDDEHATQRKHKKRKTAK